jgi:hypothetical protein
MVCHVQRSATDLSIKPEQLHSRTGLPGEATTILKLQFMSQFTGYIVNFTVPAQAQATGYRLRVAP